ncbi:hypothetical protein [Adhaeribacter pallidiroseus]|uniref:Uncharacterized protein n=1 Tax=Adhaeribacter pallidiroseus TaxID=2072847 RepID=A0A369QVL4_9BACT|nr:hypothetical protein [Adhaeribacter pallidiroseus]RDC66218.1 hypothetical protein AHMF7616_04849 [Adhaeribacter pallidiroseus]
MRTRDWNYSKRTMEKFNSLSGYSEPNKIPEQVAQNPGLDKMPAEYDISFKNMMAEVFGWSGSVLNVAGEDSLEDDASWQNNEDPEAAEHSGENIGTGTTTGDTSLDQELATNGEVGGNLATGAGAVGGTGEIGGTTTGSNTGVAGIPGQNSIKN